MQRPIPVFIIDEINGCQSHLVFIEQHKLQKRHTFVQMRDGCYTRIALPKLSVPTHGFLVRRLRSSHDILATELNQQELDVLKHDLLPKILAQRILLKNKNITNKHDIDTF